MQMQAGDILLFKAEDDFLSKIIAWGTNSPYSHVAVCVSPEMNLAIEALTRGGVRARDIRQIGQKYNIYRVKEDQEYNLNGTISFLVSKLNLRYDYKGVVFLGLIKLLEKIMRFLKTGRPLKRFANKWQKDRDYFCSELCYQAFEFGGNLDIVPDVNQADVTSPGDIAKSIMVKLIK